MIIVHDLDFSYPDAGFRLRVGELVIEAGARTALIGPSGCGKTTLLNILAGITLPAAGRVVIDGVEISSLADAARRSVRVRRIGLVFQEFELLDHLNVVDNILLTFRLSPALRLGPAVRDRAKRLAHDVGIGDKIRRSVRRLSQGERQRVAVCRALLPEPSLLLCDEPTGNLDPANRGHVLDVLVGYADRTGATLVSVTHDHDDLARFDRIVDCEQFNGSLEDGA